MNNCFGDYGRNQNCDQCSQWRECKEKEEKENAEIGIESDDQLENLPKENDMQKYKEFFECCSCLFAEGVEFMNKAEIYDAIKRECKKLESELHR